MTVLPIKVDLMPSDTTFVDALTEQSGLNVPILVAIEIAAQTGNVHVVIDQLDALAGLVDLTSGRFNEVLSFIHKCLLIKNVTIVCSCREFEFNHDVRFTVLEPALVQLSLPAWEQVVPQLQRHGLKSTDAWPEPFREILRTPQHLAVFLRRFQETGSANIFSSYQQMLDDLWFRCINTPERQNIVYRLTEHLTQRESSSAPLASFEEDAETIQALNAAEVLAVEDSRIGFRHQTLLEHARARLFAKTDESLRDHVLKRQDAILVRPTIWSVLTYLRDADPDKYEIELNALFRSELRLHVRYLLIDFLGQQKTPTEMEVVQMAKRLKVEEDRQRVLIAIRGNWAWFTEFKDSQFAAAMQWPVEAAWPMIGVICEAWSFARADCLALLEKQWMTQPDKDDLTIQTLMKVVEWEEQSVEMVCRLVRRSKTTRNWWAEQLAGQISADKPTLAPKVIYEDLRKRLHHDDARSPLELSNEWYDLAEIAEAAPTEFLESIWQCFVDISVRFHDGYGSSSVRMYNGRESFLESDPRSVRPVVEAIRLSVERTAGHNFQKFLEVTRESWSVENAVVQSMIAHGLESATASHTAFVIQFLSADPRRFFLGNYKDGDQAHSISLIEKIAPQLPENELRALEQKIVEWSMYWPDVELCEEQRIWDREARLRLLRAIPKHLMTPETAECARAEEQALPERARHNQGRRIRSGMVKEIPPMTKEQMLTADDDAIVAILSEPFDEDREPSFWSEVEGGLVCPGGVRAATRELSELAKTSPDRVFPILHRLMAEGSEEPVAVVLHGLGECPVANDAVYKLIQELAANREPSEEFRSSTASLLYNRCEPGKGLPDHICALLESWLALPWDSTYRVFGEPDDDATKEPEGTVYWNRIGGIVNADRSFWPLMAVTNGYLMRQPADTEKWFRVLEDHMPRDTSETTWQHYCRELRWITLEGADIERGVRIISQMFHRYPFVRRSKEWAQLIGTISHVLPGFFVREYLDDLWSNRTAWTAQVAGELLTLLAIRDKEHEWAISLLDQRLNDAVNGEEEFVEFFRCGVAYTAGEMWEEPSARAGVVESLRRISPGCSERVASAFGSIFWASDDFPDDEVTEKLLTIIANNPCVLHPQFVSDLVNILAGLCRFQQRRVYEIARLIVNRFGSQVGDLRTSLYGVGAHLVNIAMTLQRFDETRSDGLNLLEDLMRLGIGEAFSILDDIDIRPTTPRHTQQPRRRRRRRMR
ncbi:MAG: hypothetical protein WEB58_11205 [Planctomycetaceae bacterium]